MDMTASETPTDVTVTDCNAHAQDGAAWDAGVLLDPRDEHAAPDRYPCLWNAGAGFLFRAVVRAQRPAPPEYVSVVLAHRLEPRLAVAMSQWNLMWEAAQFRRYLDTGALPPQLERVAAQGDVNVVFVPRTSSRYYEYAPLFHLLPRAVVERHGLPLRERGQWPFLADWVDPDGYMPADFAPRLSRAWGSVVWRHLMPGSALRGFSDSDPIRVLAHNLDFWLPPVSAVIEDELRGFPLVEGGVKEIPAELDDGSVLDGAVIGRPRMGGAVWEGEEQAAQMVRRTVETADADGRLRAILDAVRSNRVVDDFSEHWTYAKEDFERKLYSKRSKITVRFVELTDTIPVHGPESEVIGRMVYDDFLTLLNERDRQIVVLLRSGVTKLTEVAELMGYRNHSAISKRLTRIREHASRIFDIDQ